MSEFYNIYCDESCHLENDREPVMLVGAVWCYKMYFSLLNKILSPDRKYNIYLDIKDTRGRQRLKLLREVLCNNVHDFTSEMIEHIQNVHSREVELTQVTDLLLGAIAYRQRGKTGQPGEDGARATH